MWFTDTGTTELVLASIIALKFDGENCESDGRFMNEVTSINDMFILNHIWCFKEDCGFVGC